MGTDQQTNAERGLVTELGECGISPKLAAKLIRIMRDTRKSSDGATISEADLLEGCRIVEPLVKEERRRSSAFGKISKP